MNTNFGFNYNAWHNIEQLANSSSENEIICTNDKEIDIEKSPNHEKIQNKEKIALILKRSLTDFLSIKNKDANQKINLYDKNNAENELIKKTFQQALKNYQSLGFEEIAPLNLQGSQISNLDIVFPTTTILENSESSAAQDLEQAQLALKKANDPILNPDVRANYMPQMTGAMTANGTYYIYGDKNLDQQSPTVDRLFIAKPAMQEAGAPKSPQKHPQTRDGIKGGEGVFRERIVYAGQNLLKLDCGIPPTFVIEEKNGFLSSEVDFDKIMANLESLKKINPEMTLEKFIDFMKKGNSLKEIINLINLQDISNLSPIEKTAYEIIKEKTAEGVNLTYPMLIRELRTTYAMAEIQSQVSSLKQLLEKSFAEKNLQEVVSTLWNQILLSTDQPAVMSIQKYVPGCQTLSWWLARYDQNNLPVEEVHKLVIDLIFFNTDRHLGNVLVDLNASQPKFVLIDHGSCLPRPLGEEEGKGLKQARYEFLELLHCDQALHPKYAETIKNLDIEQYIESLQKEQMHHQENFGEVCHIPEDCYQLIRLNLHLVQVGVEIGATLKEIGSMHQIMVSPDGGSSGGEIIDIYLKHIHNKDQIDWNQIRNDIKNILISKKK